jgi:hypothetical protein
MVLRVAQARMMIRVELVRAQLKVAFLWGMAGTACSSRPSSERGAGSGHYP